MMLLKIAFVFTSVIATFAYQEEEEGSDRPTDRYPEEEEEEQEEFSFLQGSVETKIAKLSRASDLEPDHETEYNVDASFKCTTDNGAAVEPKAFHSSPAAATAATEKLPADLQISFPEDSEDPPGASTLRTVLQFLIFLIIADGLRRWHLQKQESGVKEVIASGQKGEAALKTSWTELVKAARSGDTRSFKKALKHPSSLTHVDAWGCTPLHFAAEAGSVTICDLITKELLKLKVKVDALDAGDETPLHIAARAGHAGVCEVLLSAGANMNAANKDGITPLVVAGRANQEETCRVLADHGAGVAGLTDQELPPLVVCQIVRKVFAA